MVAPSPTTWSEPPTSPKPHDANARATAAAYASVTTYRGTRKTEEERNRHKGGDRHQSSRDYDRDKGVMVTLRLRPDICDLCSQVAWWRTVLQGRSPHAYEQIRNPRTELVTSKTRARQHGHS